MSTSPVVFSTPDFFRNYLRENGSLNLKPSDQLIIRNAHLVKGPGLPLNAKDKAKYYLGQILVLIGLAPSIQFLTDGSASTSFDKKNFYFQYTGRVSITTSKGPLFVWLNALIQEMTRCKISTFQSSPTQMVVLMDVPEKTIKDYEKNEDAFDDYVEGCSPVNDVDLECTHEIAEINYLGVTQRNILLTSETSGVHFSLLTRKRTYSDASLQKALQIGPLVLPENTPITFLIPELSDLFQTYLSTSMPSNRLLLRDYLISQMVCTLGKRVNIKSIDETLVKFKLSPHGVILECKKPFKIELDPGIQLIDLKFLGKKMEDDKRRKIDFLENQEIVVCNAPNFDSFYGEVVLKQKKIYSNQCLLMLSMPVGFMFELKYDHWEFVVSENDVFLKLTFLKDGSIRLRPADKDRFIFALLRDYPDLFKELKERRDDVYNFFLFLSLYHFIQLKINDWNLEEAPCFFSERTHAEIEELLKDSHFVRSLDFIRKDGLLPRSSADYMMLEISNLDQKFVLGIEHIKKLASGEILGSFLEESLPLALKMIEHMEIEKLLLKSCSASI